MENKRTEGFSKLEKAINSAASEKKLQEVMFKYKIIKLWSEIASGFLEESRELTKAVDFHQGCLTVACLSQELAYRIKVLSQRIIEAINTVLGRPLVYALRVET